MIFLVAFWTVFYFGTTLVTEYLMKMQFCLIEGFLLSTETRRQSCVGCAFWLSEPNSKDAVFSAKQHNAWRLHTRGKPDEIQFQVLALVRVKFRFLLLDQVHRIRGNALLIQKFCSGLQTTKEKKKILGTVRLNMTTAIYLPTQCISISTTYPL